MLLSSQFLLHFRQRSFQTIKSFQSALSSIIQFIFYVLLGPVLMMRSLFPSLLLYPSQHRRRLMIWIWRWLFFCRLKSCLLALSPLTPDRRHQSAFATLSWAPQLSQPSGTIDSYGRFVGTIRTFLPSIGTSLPAAVRLFCYTDL